MLQKIIGITLGAVTLVGFGYALWNPTNANTELRLLILVIVLIPGTLYLTYALGQRASINPKLGIISIFRRGDPLVNPKIADWIKRTSVEMFFLGLSLPKLQNFDILIRDKASKGVKINLLLPDPTDRELVLRIKSSLHRDIDYLKQLELFFLEIMPMVRAYPNAIEVRVHKQLPTFSASMFDRKFGAIEMLMFGWIAGQRLWFQVDFDGAASDVRMSLDDLWNTALTLRSGEDIQLRVEASRLLQNPRQS